MKNPLLSLLFYIALVITSACSSGEQAKRLPNQQKAIVSTLPYDGGSVLISQDSQRITRALFSKKLVTTDLLTGEDIVSSSASPFENSFSDSMRLRQSEDGSVIISYDNRKKFVSVWDGVSLEKRFQFDIYEGEDSFNLQKLELSPDGQYLATSQSYTEDIKIWDIKSGDLLHDIDAQLENPAGIDVGLTFSPDSQYRFAKHAMLESRIYNVETGDVSITLNEDTLKKVNQTYYVKFSNDSKTVRVVSGNGTIKTKDVLTGEILEKITIQRTYPHTEIPDEDAEFNKDIIVNGDAYYKGETDTVEDRVNFIEVIDAITGERIKTLGKPAPETSVDVKNVVHSFPSKITMSPNGKLVMVRFKYPSVSIWDIESSALIFEIKEGEVYGQFTERFTPDGKYVLFQNLSKDLEVYDIDLLLKTVFPQN